MIDCDVLIISYRLLFRKRKKCGINCFKKMVQSFISFTFQVKQEKLTFVFGQSK